MTWTLQKRADWNAIGWNPWPTQNQETWDPLHLPSNTPEIAKKIYFFGQNNASGEIEAIIFLGSNIGKTAFSQTSSQVNSAYAGIIARQCHRTQVFINNELRRLDWDDEETNEQIVNRIAAAIDLVGEPGIYAACQEMIQNQESDFSRQKLMTAISMARDESTERHRVNLLAVFAREGDIATRYRAVEALGNMSDRSSAAKTALHNISNKDANRQIADMAVSYSR